jgi:mono/diheme cytochrome c family protein
MHPFFKPFFPNPRPTRSPHSLFKRRSPRLAIFCLLLLFWSVLWGVGLAQARSTLARPSLASLANQPIAQTISPDPAGLVDVVPSEFQLGQELYLENCATCHVGLPPAAMPTETWRTILTDPNHYGVQITPFSEPSIYIVWNYISQYSRPLRDGEATPYRLRSSRYFRILHPKVEFGDRITVRSCAGCHPGAEQFNYRSLTAEWENAP